MTAFLRSLAALIFVLACGSVEARTLPASASAGACDSGQRADLSTTSPFVEKAVAKKEVPAVAKKVKAKR